jgi:hypothetical protein
MAPDVSKEVRGIPEEVSDATERAAGTGLTGSSGQEFVPVSVGALETEPTVIRLRLVMAPRKRARRRVRCRKPRTRRPDRPRGRSERPMSRRNAQLASNGERSAERIEAERLVVAELDAWRVRMLPDPSAPLDADALARLVASCFTTLGIDASDFSVNTVHYYRRKDISTPAGRTSAARTTCATCAWPRVRGWPATSGS